MPPTWLACFAKKYTKEPITEIVEIQAHSIYGVCDKIRQQFPEKDEELHKGTIYVDAVMIKM